MMSKIEKEKIIVVFMIKYYCKINHHQEITCENCKELIAYAQEKLQMCPFGDKKNSCSKCKVHCYSIEKREEIRKVMRYVGPRMIYLMPLEYMNHLFNKE